MPDHKRLRIFKYSRHRNVFLRWLNFCVVNSRGGARRFFYHFCPTFVCYHDIEAFNTIFTSRCNVVATTTYIFECEESTYNSWVQKCIFYEYAGIIREYDHGSTAAYKLAVATNNRGNIFSLFLQCLKIFCLSKYCICGSAINQAKLFFGLHGKYDSCSIKYSTNLICHV